MAASVRHDGPVRRATPQLQFDALTLEGALLPPEWLARVAALEAPAQEPADYGIPRGLQLRDEIGRYWRIAGAIWAEFAAARAGADPLGASRRLVRDLLVQVFGFADLAAPGERTAGGRTFPLAFEALGGRVPVVVGAPDEGLDQSVPRHGDPTPRPGQATPRRRSAWGVLQEYLNAADGALWGIASNGLALRVGRDNASLTRPAWIEADLERIFAEERYADFSALWLLAHASRFGRAGQPVHDSPLERWREAGQVEGSRARDALRVGVEEALLRLGQGFVAHPTNGVLREALAAGALTPAAYFNELLRLVYRMIFLLTVEERGILHPADADAEAVRLYAGGYGMRRLRERALRQAAHDRHGDLWASLRPVFAALGRAEGEPALALPGLGGLFGAAQCPHLDAAALENRALLAAVFRLAWLREGDALARVNWKDMGVEEFGSVYESLLELVPVVSDGGRRFGFAGAGESAGNARKLTGSYYTPNALVQQLLDTALEPVVKQRLAEHPDPRDAERALLALAVVDPACGSGHFLLAAARRLAGHLARHRVGGTPGAAEYRHALRDVVTHCIHGVDRNPMALELARMALWLEAYTPDRALGFVDHHLVCGDALLGLLDLGALQDGIPDEAFRALTGDDREVAKALTRLNRTARKELEARKRSAQYALDLGTAPLADAFAALDALADDGVAGVDAKRARFAELHAAAEGSAAALAADCFVGAFLLPKRVGVGEGATDLALRQRFPTTATVAIALDGTLAAEHPAVHAARAACEEARVLHWPLAFPQVFARGGFDVVLGNPPWEVSQLSEEEFFASRAPRVAEAPNKVAREREIAKLAAAPEGTPERAVHDEFLAERRVSEAVNVAYRGAGRFAFTAVGKMNTYALFAETMYRAVSPRGRLGVVLPTGIVTDDTTKQFFDDVVKTGRLVRIAAYENEELVFAAVHHAFKFCLMTVAGARHGAPADLNFFARQPAQVHDPRRQFRLTADDFRLLSPNTGTCPIFRSAEDAEITKRIYRRVPVLIDERRPDDEGNPWGVSFSQGLFNMASDSALFAGEETPGALPLYEAKMVHQFEHRWATYDPALRGQAVESRALTPAERADPGFVVRSRYWVDGAEVRVRLQARGWTRDWLLGWRDICRATDERTAIASVIPRAAVGDTFLLMFPAVEDARLVACLLADQNALVHDYVARQKVGGTHLKYHVKKQLPNLPPDRYPRTAMDFIVPRVLELTYTVWDLAPWARDLGHDGPPFRWAPDRRALLRAELDAWYARAYGLTPEELRYVLDPADVKGSDWPSETFRVLKQSEERQFGEYRTRRLVLKAHDDLVAGRPLAGDVPPIPDVLLAPIPSRPTLSAAEADTFAVLALVRAAGGRLTAAELAHVFALRCQPARVVDIAPADLTDAARAWSAHTSAETGGPVRDVATLLVEGEILTWESDGASPVRLAVTARALAEAQLDEWFRYEAHLLLRVLRSVSAGEIEQLDGTLPDADRALLTFRVA